jgi:hypothetical protein
MVVNIAAVINEAITSKIGNASLFMDEFSQIYIEKYAKTMGST